MNLFATPKLSPPACRKRRNRRNRERVKGWTHTSPRQWPKSSASPACSSTCSGLPDIGIPALRPRPKRKFAAWSAASTSRLGTPRYGSASSAKFCGRFAQGKNRCPERRMLYSRFIHGLASFLRLLLVGHSAPGNCHRSLHPTPSGYILALYYSHWWLARRPCLHRRGGHSGFGFAAHFVPGVPSSQAHSRTRISHSRQSLGRQLRGTGTPLPSRR